MNIISMSASGALMVQVHIKYNYINKVYEMYIKYSSSACGA